MRRWHFHVGRRTYRVQPPADGRYWDFYLRSRRFGPLVVTRWLLTPAETKR